jgi:hypothetical protein
MTAFGLRFPELGARETRSIMLPYPQGGLPAGNYGFLELYCDDPKCDCRRVLLQVRAEHQPDTVLATINYGWESLAFYTQWLHGDREAAREIVDASLDPLNAQSPYSQALLRLFQTVVLSDRAYIQRLARHYALFKAHREPPRRPPQPPGSTPPPTA